MYFSKCTSWYSVSDSVGWLTADDQLNRIFFSEQISWMFTLHESYIINATMFIFQEEGSSFCETRLVIVLAVQCIREDDIISEYMWILLTIRTYFEGFFIIYTILKADICIVYDK